MMGRTINRDCSFFQEARTINGSTCAFGIHECFECPVANRDKKIAELERERDACRAESQDTHRISDSLLGMLKAAEAQITAMLGAFEDIVSNASISVPEDDDYDDGLLQGRKEAANIAEKVLTGCS